MTMTDNEQLIRELYACAEGDRGEFQKAASFFANDGFMLDMPTGKKFRGRAIGDSLEDFASAFPDVHRELLDIYVAGDVVVVELATRGTHRGELILPSGSLAPTGKRIDFPSCDVYHVRNGKVTSFHCYNTPSALLQQLGISPG
jgi:ketosteroid isomerase-like protein